MPLRAHIAVLVLAVFCGPALAADIVGYSEAFDTLFSVDLTTRTAQEIGRATPPGSPRYSIIDGLTFSPDRKLYGISDAASVKTLLQINSGNGLAKPIGLLNLGTNQQLDLSLAFTADGKLWLSSGPGDLWQVNPANATVRLVGNLGVKITGLTSRGNTLYGAGGQGNNSLYLIDQASAQASLIGVYGSGIGYVTAASPAFDGSGQLWVILDYVPPPSGSTQAQWSDLARGGAGGTLANLGQITAPADSQSFSDLQFIGLRGFAISAPGAGAASTDATPALARLELTTLALILVVLAGTRLRRRHPMS